MDNRRIATYRTDKTPSTEIPFGARSVGHYTVTADYIEQPRRKTFLQLFWCITGEGEFTHQHKAYILPAQHIFIYFPGDTHEIKSRGADWEYRWLTLDGPLNTAVVKAFGLKRGIRYSGPCPENLFMDLEQAISGITPFSQRRAAAVAFQILTLACGQPPLIQAKDVLIEKCRAIIDKEFLDASLSIKDISSRLSIHRSSLCRLFKMKIGISPQEYISQLRIRKAMTLLRESEQTIAQVAEASGYHDPNYFSRAIKRTTGMGPREIRKELQP